MVEFLDVYDANGKLIGPCGRNVVHAFGLWHRTVHCWILWNGKMVFQRRSKRLDNNPNKLYTSASGHVAAGETVIDAMRRELSEELSLSVDKLDARLLREFVWIGDFNKSDGALFQDRVFCSTFSAEIPDIREIKMLDGEIDSAVAIDIEGFAKWSRDPNGEIGGTEWDGKNLADIKLKPADFCLIGNETVYSKFGWVAEMLKKS